MTRTDTIEDASEMALMALAWTLAEPKRAERLLATTGLDPATLRAGVGDPSMLAAILTFLEAYEPDLVAAAADLDVTPDRLVAARCVLETHA